MYFDLEFYMSKVLFCMFDGVRPDAIEQADCPNIQSLRERGAWTMQARSVMPCITLPCHATIFHSLPPSRHGITDNTWRPMARPVPGLVDLIAPTSKTAAFVYNWEPLRDLSRPGSLDYSIFRNCAYQFDGDDFVAEETRRLLADGQPPDFVFAYFGTVDTAGHAFGWMSAEYLRQLERADRDLGLVLSALPDDYAVVLQADHGGHERNHGDDIPEDMTIPWIAAGPGIKRVEIRDSVSLLDTAPTIARLLGIKPHREWEGRVIEEIIGQEDQFMNPLSTAPSTHRRGN